MGLFHNYLKEGPGVDTNAPEMKGFPAFLDVLTRKFGKLTGANILYFVTSIPFLAVAFIFLTSQVTLAFVPLEILNASNDNVTFYNMVFCCLLLNFFGSGPASAAYAYVTRSFTRSEPVWVISDGFDKLKENFKYAILLSLVDIVVIYVASIAIGFYSVNTGIVSTCLYILMIAVFAIYALAHVFMYQIMVTYDCKFKLVIKNGILFTIAKLPVCLLLAVIAYVILELVFRYMEGAFGLVFYAILGLTFTKFPLEFYAARVIKKYMDYTARREEK